MGSPPALAAGGWPTRPWANSQACSSPYKPARTGTVMAVPVHDGPLHNRRRPTPRPATGENCEGHTHRWPRPGGTPRVSGCPVRAESASSLSAGTYGAQHFRQRAPLGRAIRDREALGASRCTAGAGTITISTKYWPVLTQWHLTFPVTASPPSRQERGLHEYAEWVAPVLHDIGDGPWVVLGHSFGARVAVHLAALNRLPRPMAAQVSVPSCSPVRRLPRRRGSGRPGRRSRTGPDGRFIAWGSYLTPGWNSCDANMGRMSTSGPLRSCGGSL